MNPASPGGEKGAQTISNGSVGYSAGPKTAPSEMSTNMINPATADRLRANISHASMNGLLAFWIGSPVIFDPPHADQQGEAPNRSRDCPRSRQAQKRTGYPRLWAYRAR